MTAIHDRLREGKENLSPAYLPYSARGVRVFVVELVWALLVVAVGLVIFVFFFKCSGHHRDLPSSPPRRSPDLDQALALIGAANLDDEESPDAGDLRWDRETNRPLAFGGGIHRCLGSPLARLELRVALREWHRRIPDYRVKPGVELDYSPGIRSVDTFPMVLGPGPASPSAGE